MRHIEGCHGLHGADETCYEAGPRARYLSVNEQIEREQKANRPMTPENELRLTLAAQILSGILAHHSTSVDYEQPGNPIDEAWEYAGRLIERAKETEG